MFNVSSCGGCCLEHLERLIERMRFNLPSRVFESSSFIVTYKTDKNICILAVIMFLMFSGSSHDTGFLSTKKQQQMFHSRICVKIWFASLPQTNISCFIGYP